MAKNIETKLRVLYKFRGRTEALKIIKDEFNKKVYSGNKQSKHKYLLK